MMTAKAGTSRPKNNSRQLSILVFSMFLLRQTSSSNQSKSQFRAELKMLSRSLAIATISSAGWIFGLVPGLSFGLETPTINMGSTATAQVINNAQVSPFVQSTLEIELAREATLQKTRSLSPNGSIPIFDCDLAAGTVTNIDSFSSQLRQPLQNFCNQSQAILRQNQLSPAQFREIKNKYESNPQQFPQITRLFQRLCQDRKYQRLQICR